MATQILKVVAGDSIGATRKGRVKVSKEEKHFVLPIMHADLVIGKAKILDKYEYDDTKGFGENKDWYSCGVPEQVLTDAGVTKFVVTLSL
jgi:hypothetical protein